MKILVVQLAYLGDVVLSTPVLAAVKELYPDASLSVLTTPGGAALLQHGQHCDEILIFDKRGEFRGASGLIRMAKEIREREFDTVYSLHGSARTSLLLYLARVPLRIGFDRGWLRWLYTRRVQRSSGGHAVERNLSLLEAERKQRRIDLPESMRLGAPQLEEVSEQIQRFVAGGSYVVVAPGSAWKTKRWHQDGYRSLVSELLLQGERVVLVGAPEERELGEAVARNLSVCNLIGKTSLPELLLLIERATVLVCNDSSTLHMGSAFQVPTVAIFCATVPEFGFGPWRNQAVVLGVEDLPCRPCGRHGGQRCPTGTHLCMTGVAAKDVLVAVNSFINQSKVSELR